VRALCASCASPASARSSCARSAPSARDRLRAAEIDYVRSLIGDIESGTLDGADWRRQVHEHGFDQVPPPFDPGDVRQPGK